MLEVVALAGPRVDPALVEAVVGAPPSAIDELLAAGLLAGDGDRLRFRHEIARLAVEQAIPPHRRTTIHRAVLDALCAAGGADDARLAFHAEGAGDAALVLRHAPEAGRRASDLAAHREAAAQFERALRFCDGADARTRATLHDALAYECSLIDHWEECAQNRAAALALWREVGDLLRVGDDLHLYARTMWRLCRGEEERAAGAEALEVLEELGPSAELARALVYGAGDAHDRRRRRRLPRDGRPGDRAGRGARPARRPQRRAQHQGVRARRPARRVVALAHGGGAAGRGRQEHGPAGGSRLREPARAGVGHARVPAGAPGVRRRRGLLRRARHRDVRHLPARRPHADARAHRRVVGGGAARAGPAHRVRVAGEPAEPADQPGPDHGPAGRPARLAAARRGRPARRRRGRARVAAAGATGQGGGALDRR